LRPQQPPIIEVLDAAIVDRRPEQVRALLIHAANTTRAAGSLEPLNILWDTGVSNPAVYDMPAWLVTLGVLLEAGADPFLRAGGRASIAELATWQGRIGVIRALARYNPGTELAWDWSKRGGCRQVWDCAGGSLLQCAPHLAQLTSALFEIGGNVKAGQRFGFWEVLCRKTDHKSRERDDELGVVLLLGGGLKARPSRLANLADHGLWKTADLLIQSLGANTSAWDTAVWGYLPGRGADADAKVRLQAMWLAHRMKQDSAPAAAKAGPKVRL
jgi:hypothetical protein